MTKILLDLQTLQSNSRDRGIGNYSRGLADALMRQPGIEWHVLLSDAMPEALPSVQRWVRERLPPERVHVLHGLPLIHGSQAGHGVRARAAEVLYGGFVEALNVDLVHVASPFDGWGDDTVLDVDAARQTAYAATVYDLIPFEDPELFLPTPNIADWFARRLQALGQVEAALAISEHTAGVVRKQLRRGGDSVVAIGADVAPIFGPRTITEPAARALTARYRITRPFLIHVGIPEPRKNIARLIEAFSRLPNALRESHQIVLVTRVTDAQRESLLGLARHLQLPDDAIVLPGFVPDPDLADLYALAQATVMPSLNEGFGLPLLEAMRCGCPVLGSNTTSIPEVIGRDDLTFDPLQVASITDRIERMLSDSAFRSMAIAHARLQQQKFSWAASADRACEAFRRSILNRKSASAPPARLPDIAKLTPGRYLLPLTPWPDAPEPVDPLPYPDGSQALDAVLVEAGPCALLDLSNLSDEEIALPAHATDTMIGSTRTESAHRNLVATIDLEADASSRWRLTWHSWPRTASRAFEPGMCSSVPEALSRIVDRHPLPKVARPLARLNALRSQIDGPVQRGLALALADNHAPACAKSRLLVDVTELAQRDARSGIQRVVRNILGVLLRDPAEFAVVPVRRDGSEYRYARIFTARMLGNEASICDSLLDFRPGDTFLALDFDAMITPEAVAIQDRQHTRGVRFVHVLYDTLPLHRPDWWGGDMHGVYTRWLRGLAAYSDGIACISQAVADDVAQILVERRFVNARRPAIKAFHLGADLDAAHAAEAIDPEMAAQTPALFEPDTPVFVTVGTLEPRKGHAQLLDAAELLWARGSPAVFAIVGKRGWLVDELIERITTHPERDRRLRWFDAVDDSVLALVYRAGTAAILPSEGEGFGLPLVEAAHAGLPILARDLAVFREIGGAHATYFNGFDGAALADAIERWLAAHARGQTPHPAGIQPLTWSQSARQLLDVVRAVPHRP